MEDIIRDRFEVNNKEHISMAKQVEILTDKMVKFELNITRQIEKIPIDLQKAFDERYASKETELTVKRVQWLIISSVITALLGLVIVERLI